MIPAILFVLLSSSLGSIDLVRSIAPGDEDVLCTQEPQFALSHPPNQRLLLDSYNYQSLFPQVWKKLDVDGEGQGWTQMHTNSGTCRSIIQVCDYQNGSKQNNWLFTQYISYPSLYASEIFVRITYKFSRCHNNPVCDIPYFNVLHYDTDSPNPHEQVKSTNYDLIKQIEQPNSDNATTTTISFKRPSNSSGLYLAVQDVGFCGYIMRIRVYYEQCPSKIVGLVTYPALPLPGKSSLVAAEGSAVCAANAKNLSRLEFGAFSDGECERSVTCECLPGYVEEQQLFSGTNLLVLQCKACGPGMYRSEFDLSCQHCPQNSESPYAASVECLCLDGYFRVPSEGPDSPCTAPPSGCTGASVISVTATDVTVEWKRPNLTGRADFYYRVYYRELTSFSGITLGRYVNNSDYVDYTINGLRPSTRYVIRITVHNGVSDQDVENELSRMCETVASTADMGQPRNVSGFCRVVTWRPPLTAGTGTQLGYVVRLFIPGTDEDIVIKKAAGELYHIIQESDKSNSLTEYFVQVRSTIGVVNGSWSMAVPLVPLTPVILYARDGFIIWNGTNMISDSPYEIRYKQSGSPSQNLKTVSSNKTLLAYPLHNLETDARYTVEVRQINGNRTGNWSLPYSFQTTDSTILAIISHPKSSNVVAGDDIELTCTARGSVPLLFVWGTTANISSVGLPPSLQTTNPDKSVTSVLHMINAGREHTGEYLCIVMDSTGSRLLSQPANISVLTPDTGLPRTRISFNQSSYLFNESKRFASVGVHKQGNISEPISINVTAVFNRTNRVFPSVEEFNQIITLSDSSQSTAMITIPLITDMIALEDFEIVILQMEIVNPVPEYVLLTEPTSAVIYVLDDTLVSVGFSVSAISVLEGVGSVAVCINKSADTIIPVTVSAESLPLTANSETDFMISQGKLEVVFGRTERRKCFSIQLVDDSAPEDDEMFQLLIASTSPVDSRMQLDLTTVIVTIVDDDIVSGLRFSVGGCTYPNNSVISLWNVGENDEALSCITDYTQCCSAFPYRQGEFYYPNGERVRVQGTGDGMYRNRGNQEIRLNRKKDVTPLTGRFRCELPNANGVIQSIYINLSQAVISFEQASYTFREDIDVGRVCLERSGYIQEQNDIRITGAIQGQSLNEVVSFLPADIENKKCIDISIVDDDVALEGTEEWTLRLETTESQNYALGDIHSALVQVTDDDELTMSLVKIANVSEDSGEVDICVQFSSQFVDPFEIFLNVSASPGNASVAQPGVDYTLPTPVTVSSEHSRNGKACLNLTITDDNFAEADECLVITVTATKSIAPVSDYFCITDNDGVQVSFQRPAYMFLENQGTVDICVKKIGFISETIQIILFGALQRESGQTLNQILTFSPNDSVKCSVFMLVDDDLGLEEIEFLTISLIRTDLSPSQKFSFGQYNQTSVGILDDDELILSVVKASNFTENAGHAEVCLTFSLQFVSSFTIRLSTVVSPNITILHRATPDIDYAAIPLTLSPGIEDSRNGSLCFKFAIFDDEIVEPDECISISIESAPDMVRIAENGTTTTLCIIDDDQDVVIGFSQSIYSVREDSGEIQVSVRIISGEIKRLSTVSISTVSGTALYRDDYLMIAGEVLQFGPGLLQHNVSIPIANDNVVEAMESFSTLLTTTTAGVTLAPSESLIYILDNDVLVGFEHVAYSVNETVGQLMINISVLDGILTHPISVVVSTSDGTATGNTDYVSVAANLQWLTPEDSSTVISIGIVNDNITEGEENFTLALLSASPEVNISPSSAVITILDDDSQDVIIGFESTSYTVEESAGVIQLTIDIVGRTTGPFSISYSTLNDTAIGGSDFQQRSETVTVFPSDTQVLISVQIFSDNLLEGEERFSVLIASSSEEIMATRSIAQITIVDSSEVIVEFGSSNYSVQESADHIEVCLTLDGMAVFPISFRISASETSPRDAEDGADFIATTNDAVLQPLSSKICTEFTILSDNIAEAQTEIFMVTFTTVSDIQMGTNDRATVSIMDSYSGDLYFMLNGQRITYNSEATVNIRDIGTGDNALLCFTDQTSCCSGSGRAGEWYYPDGRRVNIQGAGEDFYRNRGNRVLRLNRARNVIAPTGRYRCEVSDATGTTQNIFISITVLQVILS